MAPSITYNPSCTDIAARCGVHLSFVIDDTVGGIARHGAAAERVHRDEAVTEETTPHRVLDENAAERASRRFDLCVVVIEDRPLSGIRPVDSQPIILQIQAPIAAVVAHDQKRLCMGQRALARTADEAL